MKRSYFPILIATLSLSAGWAAMTQASAQTVEQFYKGKTITVLVGTSPGGINDITARFAAKHFSRYIPGNPDDQRPVHARRRRPRDRQPYRQRLGGRRPDACQARTRDAAARDPGLSAGEVRPDEAELARQHVVLRQRRLSDAAQSRHADQIGRRHPRRRARQDHARRQQRRVVEPHLRHHRQGSTEPEHQRRARLHRRGADVPRHAAQGDRRSVRRNQLGENRPARHVGAAAHSRCRCCSAAPAVIPISRTSRPGAS